MNKELIKNKISRFIKRKISTDMYISSLKLYEGSNKVDLSIGYEFPRVIYDDEFEKQHIYFIRFDDIAKISCKITSSSDISADIELQEIYDTITKKKMRLQNKIEKIILNEIYPKLFDVPLLQNRFRPIYNILNHIWLAKRFTSADFITSKNKDKLIKYLKFLENMDMIRKTKDGDWIMGNIPSELKFALRDKNDVIILKKLFGYSIKEGRKYLREELNVSMVEVYIEIISTYYVLASKLNKSVKILPDTFYEEFKSVYVKSNLHKTKFLAYLTDLVEAKLLSKQDNYFLGDYNLVKKVSLI